MHRDTVITRRTGSAGTAASRTQGPREVLPPERLSERSRKRAMMHLRNTTTYGWFVVLTLPRSFKDDRQVKRALDKFATWSNRRGASFFWKQEFRGGSPHFHLLTTSALPIDEASRVWADALGVTHAKIHSEPIRSMEASQRYVLKPCDDLQNRVPDGYKNMGRFWGTRGPKAKPEKLLEVAGSPAEVARLIRPLRSVQKAERKQKSKAPVPDSGIVGRTLYDLGGEAIAQPLRRLVSERRHQARKEKKN